MNAIFFASNYKIIPFTDGTKVKISKNNKKRTFIVKK